MKSWKVAAGLAVAGTIAAVALGQVAARASSPPDAENGHLGSFQGEGGDPVVGAKVYEEHCSGCHDTGAGRAPAKSSISDNTRLSIITALREGVMKPMAEGLTYKEVAGVAAYLSTRKDGGLGALGQETPKCAGKPPAIDLTTSRQWNGWGVTAKQARYQPHPDLAAADVPRLKLKWAFAYANSRGGQATVIGDRLFLNASSGAVYALNARTGCAYWRFDAPAPSRGTIVVGPLRAAPSGHAVYFADYTKTVYALDADNGTPVWKTRIDDQREVQMTGSPTIGGGVLFVPISSAEEAIATTPGYECCKFRGALAAVDAASGRLLWKTYVTPKPATPFKKNAAGLVMYGPAGGAIWSSPTYDAKRGLVYVGTGDSYTDVEFPTADAILALDARTGATRWVKQLTVHDNYIIGCYGPKRGPNCPTVVGGDFDFGASPILHTVSGGREVLLAGQKSSQVYALDPDANGRLIWSRRLSPGGPLGGVEFGMAADADTLYAAVSDIFVPFGQGRPGLTALRIKDGALLWTTPAPKLTCAWTTPYCFPGMSQAVSAIPGVVFGGSMDGRLRAFDTASGRVVWTYDTGGAMVSTVTGGQARGGVLDGAGPTVAGGMVYVNSGYEARSGRPGSVLMAFSADGR